MKTAISTGALIEYHLRYETGIGVVVVTRGKKVSQGDWNTFLREVCERESNSSARAGFIDAVLKRVNASFPFPTGTVSVACSNRLENQRNTLFVAPKGSPRLDHLKEITTFDVYIR